MNNIDLQVTLVREKIAFMKEFLTEIECLCDMAEELSKNVDRFCDRIEEKIGEIEQTVSGFVRIDTANREKLIPNIPIGSDFVCFNNAKGVFFGYDETTGIVKYKDFESGEPGLIREIHQMNIKGYYPYKHTIQICKKRYIQTLLDGRQRYVRVYIDDKKLGYYGSLLALKQKGINVNNFVSYTMINNNPSLFELVKE